MLPHYITTFVALYLMARSSSRKGCHLCSKTCTQYTHSHENVSGILIPWHQDYIIYIMCNKQCILVAMWKSIQRGSNLLLKLLTNLAWFQDGQISVSWCARFLLTSIAIDTLHWSRKCACRFTNGNLCGSWGWCHMHYMWWSRASNTYMHH